MSKHVFRIIIAFYFFPYLVIVTANPILSIYLFPCAEEEFQGSYNRRVPEDFKIASYFNKQH